MAATGNLSHRGHLEAELTSFVGRRGEISQVRRQLESSRLVTLTGVGGAGKTRLAIRVALGMRRVFPDGVWQVDLAGVRDPALLACTVAQALGIDDQTDRPVLEAIVDYLRDCEVLLIFDNCEHLLDACAEMVGAVLGDAPGVRILSTSRQPLGILGERVWQVPPLPVPDPDRPLPTGAGLRYPALDLFAERAGAVHPGFALTPENAGLVAQVCRDLDGVPLAIELAAARLRALSLPQLADRLWDWVRLSQTRYARPAHHQTLRASFDWSHALCTGTEQELWAALSVFAEGFDVVAAAYVCAGEVPTEQVVTALDGLVDKSVLIRDDAGGSDRYRLLKTVREYGLVRLRERPGDEDAARRRHRDFYLRLAERGETGWSGPEQENTYLALRRERANLRGALDFCLRTPGEAHVGLHLAGTLWFYWTGCGFLREGRYWLDRFLAADPAPSAERTRALWATGAVAVAEGDDDGAARLLAETWQEASRTGDERILGLVELSLGTVALFADEYPRARELFERALARFDALGHVNPSMLMGRSELAMIVAVQGDLDRAEKICRVTLAACEQRGDRWAAGWVFYVLALVALARGNVDEAVGQARQGLRGMLVFHNLTGIAMLIELYATILIAAGAPERAAVMHGVAEQTWRIIGKRLFGSAALRDQHQKVEMAARQVLGDAGYEAAYRGGSRLAFDEAMAYALDDAPAKLVAARPAPTSWQVLTPREREVADLVGQGLSNREIATRLFTSQRTAESHVEHILCKLGFHARSQIAAWTAGHERADGG